MLVSVCGYVCEQVHILEARGGHDPPPIDANGLAFAQHRGPGTYEWPSGLAALSAAVPEVHLGMGGGHQHPVDLRDRHQGDRLVLEPKADFPRWVGGWAGGMLSALDVGPW